MSERKICVSITGEKRGKYMVGDIIEFDEKKYLVLATLDYRDKPYWMVVDKENQETYKILKCEEDILKEEENKHIINRLLPEFSKEINSLIDEVMGDKNE